MEMADRERWKAEIAAVPVLATLAMKDSPSRPGIAGDEEEGRENYLRDPESDVGRARQLPGRDDPISDW